jgi:hypothetical protein
MSKMNKAEPDAKCSRCGDPIEEGDLCEYCCNALGHNDNLSSLIEQLIEDKIKLDHSAHLNEYARARYQDRVDMTLEEIDRRFPNVY